MNNHATYLLLTGMLYGSASIALCQSASGSPALPPPADTSCGLQSVTVQMLCSGWGTNSVANENRAGMGDWLQVEVKALLEGLIKAIFNKIKVGLFLNQAPLNGRNSEVSLTPNTVPTNSVARFRFHIEWIDASFALHEMKRTKEAWENQRFSPARDGTPGGREDFITLEHSLPTIYRSPERVAALRVAVQATHNKK